MGTLLGALAGLATVLVVAVNAIKAGFPRVRDGYQAVTFAWGKIKLRKNISDPWNRPEGWLSYLDDAELIDLRMSPMWWPKQDRHLVKITDEVTRIEFTIDREENGEKVQYLVIVDVIWGVMPSHPNGINYAARAVVDGQYQEGKLTDLALAPVKEELRKLYEDAKHSLSALGIGAFVFKQIEPSSREGMVKYGSDLRGIKVQEIRRSNAQVIGGSPAGKLASAPQ